jgi:hypothetical protein
MKLGVAAPPLSLSPLSLSHPRVLAGRMVCAVCVCVCVRVGVFRCLSVAVDAIADEWVVLLFGEGCVCVYVCVGVSVALRLCR